MEPRRGSYLGTERDGRWWKRALGEGLFVKGLGSSLIDEHGIVFRRIGINRDIVIPYASMRGVRIGNWHGGTWSARRPILKIDWEHVGRAHSSGFLIPDRTEAARVRDDLTARINAG